MTFDWFNESVFIDTNILVYAYDEDAGEKHSLARDIVRHLWQRIIPPTISVQVLQEFYVTLLKQSVPIERAQEIVAPYRSWQPLPITATLFQAALGLHASTNLSFWDSLIVGAAQKSKCGTLVSEDMQHGGVVGGVRIENPFV